VSVRRASLFTLRLGCGGRYSRVTELKIDGRTWTLGESLGSGGFGRVYAATLDGEEAVAKLVPKDPGAQRELLLAGDLSGVPNVVPVIGVGETDDSWAIVMPRAEQSLRNFLEALGRPLEQSEAVPVLLDVTQALVSLSAKDVVHRDLKPDNVLLLDGRWCLTDFGISRYAEATTAIDTWKYSMTKPYAAPEQWRTQRATSATDVYAFSIMAFEMLIGRWPFEGPDFRDQHLHQVPPSLSAEVDSPLRSIIDECLTKAPQARPTAARLVSRLKSQSAAEAPAGGVAALIEAHREQVIRISEQARRESEAQSETERRADLFAAATQVYERIRSKLCGVVQSAAPSVEDAWPLRLGEANLQMTSPVPSTSTVRLPFDVVAHAEIQVDQSKLGTYSGRTHSLWFCDARESGQYAWFETVFMVHPMMHGQLFTAAHLYDPFAASPNDDVALQSLGPGIGTYQSAWPFTALIDDDLSEFIDRWATLLALASSGRLQVPSQMPERPIHDSWRRT
jgi:serine/threonine protein kinase